MVVNSQHSVAAIKRRKSAVRIFTSTEFALLGRLHRYPPKPPIIPIISFFNDDEMYFLIDKNTTLWLNY
jgi:hypothetical protein